MSSIERLFSSQRLKKDLRQRIKNILLGVLYRRFSTGSKQFMWWYWFQFRGEYVLEIEVQSYSNPSSRCGGAECGCTSSQGCRCCDDNIDDPPSPSCNARPKPCDNQFTYCLQRRASAQPAREGGVCPQGSSRAETSGVNWNDARINFAAATVLGLSNGFTLPGVGSSWMVNLLCRAKNLQSTMYYY